MPQRVLDIGQSRMLNKPSRRKAAPVASADNDHISCDGDLINETHYFLGVRVSAIPYNDTWQVIHGDDASVGVGGVVECDGPCNNKQRNKEIMQRNKEIMVRLHFPENGGNNSHISSISYSWLLANMTFCSRILHAIYIYIDIFFFFFSL